MILDVVNQTDLAIYPIMYTNSYQRENLKLNNTHFPITPPFQYSSKA